MIATRSRSPTDLTWLDYVFHTFPIIPKWNMDFARKNEKPSRVEWGTGTADAQKKTLKDKDDSLFFTSFSSFWGTSRGTLDFYRKLHFYLTLLSERLETRSSFLLKIGSVPLKVPFQSPYLCGRHACDGWFAGWTTPTAQINKKK
jgi:hypothetical protein